MATRSPSSSPPKMLLEAETLEMLSSALRVAKNIGMLPYQLNSKRRRIRVVKSDEYRRRALLNQALFLTGVPYLCWLSHVTITKLRGRVPEAVWAYFIFLLIILPLVAAMHQIIYQYRYALAVGLNSLIALSETFDGFGVSTLDEDTRDRSTGRKLRRLLGVMQFAAKRIILPAYCSLPFVYWSPCVLLVAELFRPLEEYFLPGLRIPRLVHMALILFACPFYFYAGACGLWFGYAAVAWALTMAWYFDHALKHKLRPRLTEHPQNAVRLYKGIYVLVRALMTPMSTFIAFYQFMTLVLGSFQLYFLAARAHGGPHFDWLLALAFFGSTISYMSFTFHKFGNANTVSVALLESWRMEYVGRASARHLSLTPGRAFERRALRSLLPIRIYAGSMYYYDRMAFINLWHLIIDKAIVILSCFPLDGNVQQFEPTMAL